MKKLLIVIFFPLILLVAGLGFCFRSSPGFNVYKISSNLKPAKIWEVRSPPIEEKQNIDQILSQPFMYLGAGAQSYAFVSADGGSVLKFFRMNNLLPKPWQGGEKKQRKMAKLKKTFEAYRIAYEEFKEESGLLLVHLNRSSDLQKKVTLTDRKGETHLVDLDNTVFVLQKRADLIYDHLEKLQGESAALKKALTSLFRLILTRAEKGIADEDHGVRNNFGFSADKPIQIDIGRIAQDKHAREHSREELTRVASKIKAWAEEKMPNAVPLIDEAVEERMNDE